MNHPPTPENVNDALADIARASGERSEFNARKAVADYRVRQVSLQPGLTQAQIDSGSEMEDRRQRFVQSSVRWSKRSLWAKLFRWR